MSFDRPLAAPVRIDLACGQNPRAGFEGADLFAPNAQHKLDVLKFPWRPLLNTNHPNLTVAAGEPWADNSVEELHCSHFVEHIPMAFIDKTNVAHLTPDLDRKDMFFAFFDEAFRVLRADVKADPAKGFPGQQGGKMTVIVPYLQNARAFQDPTHRRFLCEASFLYLVRDWRNANGLSHYGVEANFDMHLDCLTDAYESARNPETQGQRKQHMWNVVSDLVVTMYKRT
jgi:hypothetical protein